MVCTAHQISFGWSKQEEWDGGTCSTYGDEGRCIEVWWGNLRKDTTWMT